EASRRGRAPEVQIVLEHANLSCGTCPRDVTLAALEAVKDALKGLKRAAFPPARASLAAGGVAARRIAGRRLGRTACHQRLDDFEQLLERRRGSVGHLSARRSAKGDAVLVGERRQTCSA